MKHYLFLITLLLLVTLLPASAESIWISSPSDSATFGDETITLYAQVSNSSMPVPFIKYSHDPSQAPPMIYWGSDIYIYNINFSDFPDGSWSILVSSGIHTDSINISKESTTTTPTPTPTPEPPKHLHITGLTDGDSYDNSSLFFIVYNNDTMEPVNQPVWYLWYQNRIVNTGTGYFSGRCNIEWVDDYASPLDDGAYLIQIKSDGYEPAEFLVSLASPIPPVDTDESMTVFGLDKRVADDVTLWIYVMDKSDNDRYVEDVTVKVLDQAGTTITSMVTDINGRVLINWQEITDLASGEYSQYAVEFTKPGYNRKVVDTTVVSSIPTPTPTPTLSPTPTPVSTPVPVHTANPSLSSVSATTQDEVDSNSKTTLSSFPSLLIFLTFLSGGGLCFAVIFPDQTKGARDSVVGKLKEKGRRASKTNREQDMIICSATDKGPTGIETKCQNPAVPGTRYCLEHAYLNQGRQPAQSPHVPPPVEDVIPTTGQLSTLLEAPEDEPDGPEDNQEPGYDGRLMVKEVATHAAKMVINKIPDNIIKAEIKNMCGVNPPDAWMMKVTEAANKIIGESKPDEEEDGTHD